MIKIWYYKKAKENTLYLVLGKHNTKTQYKANKELGGVNNDKGKKTRNH